MYNILVVTFCLVLVLSLFSLMSGMLLAYSLGNVFLPFLNLLILISGVITRVTWAILKVICWTRPLAKLSRGGGTPFSYSLRQSFFY